MKKISQLIITSVLLIVTGLFTYIDAQDVNPLPNDPRVKSGKTANGLKYIVIHNDAQKESAHFCIAQKVGTSLESGNNIGSFMLLEQLATRGTRNFEGNSITDYLRTLGVTSDKITFETTPDKLIYTIKDVPTKSQNTIDSSLLILYNWMCAINLDEEDVAIEKNILRNRILSSQGRAEQRLQQEQINKLYPNSPYSKKVDDNSSTLINNLNSRDLRSFYYTWCRPDLQCVIVVGDVDPTKVETQIKSIFATIPKPLSKEQRTYYKLPTFEGTKAIVLKDKEYNNTTVEISLLKEPVKDEYKKTNLPYIQDYMDDALFFLLTNRLRDKIVEQGVAIYDINISKGNYLGIANTLSYTISYNTIPSSIYNTISLVSNEITKIVQQGFTKQEFNSTIDLYWRRLENGYDNRSTFANDIYLQRGLNAYFEGYSLASTEMNFEIMKEILYSLNLKDLNEYARLLLSQKNNSIICCKMPDNPAIELPSEERLKSSLSVTLLDIANEEQHFATWPKVVLKSEPTIVQQNNDALSGEKILLLSNGARVVLKNSHASGDTISFKAVSYGGFSLIKGVNLGNQNFFNDVLNINKIAGVSFSDMKRLYAYNHIDLESQVTPNTEELTGWARSTQMNKLLEAIYLNFTQREEDKNAYEIYSQRIKYYTKYKSISPDGIFADSVNYYNNSNKKYTEPITENEIDNYNYITLHRQLKERFTNGADFTFIFVGENVEEYTEQIVQYIGNIPSDESKKESYIIVPNYRRKGDVRKNFFAKMRVPNSQANVTYSASCAASSNTFILSQITKHYLNRFATENLDRSITAFDINSNIELYPEEMFVLTTNFESDSINITKAIRLTDNLLENLAKNKIDERIWNLAIYDIAKNFKGEKENQQETLNYLTLKYLYSLDTYFEVADLLSIKKEEFAEFIKELISNGNRISVIMDGTTADVETLRLLRENEFIRQYFDIQ